MDTSDSSSTDNMKMIKIASLYGLTDPFFEPSEALEKVYNLKKQAQRELLDKDLRFLFIVAGVLNLKATPQTLRNTYTHININKRYLKRAATLYSIAEKGNLSIQDASKKVYALNDELKAQGVEKSLRKMTILASLIDRDTEPYYISKKLNSIQRMFNYTREKE